MMRTASARKNGSFGFKALVKWPDGRVFTPIRRNFPSREAATAYAQKFIDANDSRPLGIDNRKPKVRIDAPHSEGA
ncbi:hypothetical protein D3C87_1755470 [compost metagenome]